MEGARSDSLRLRFCTSSQKFERSLVPIWPRAFRQMHCWLGADLAQTLISEGWDGSALAVASRNIVRLRQGTGASVRGGSFSKPCCYVAVWRAALQDCLDRACDVSRNDLSRCCLGPTLVQLPSQLPTISAISQDDNASRRLQIIGSNQRRRQISGTSSRAISSMGNQRRRQISGTSLWRCWRRWKRRRWQISV